MLPNPSTTRRWRPSRRGRASAGARDSCHCPAQVRRGAGADPRRGARARCHPGVHRDVGAADERASDELEMLPVQSAWFAGSQVAGFTVTGSPAPGLGSSPWGPARNSTAVACASSHEPHRLRCRDGQVGSEELQPCGSLPSILFTSTVTFASPHLRLVCKRGESPGIQALAQRCLIMFGRYGTSGWPAIASLAPR